MTHIHIEYPFLSTSYMIDVVGPQWTSKENRVDVATINIYKTWFEKKKKKKKKIHKSSNYAKPGSQSKKCAK